MLNGSDAFVSKSIRPIVFCGSCILFFFYEFVFSKSADRAYPVFRKILKSCARLDPVVRIANFRVINISARFAYITFHLFGLLI